MAIFFPQQSLPLTPTLSKVNKFELKMPLTPSNAGKLSITKESLSKHEHGIASKSHLNLHTVVNAPKQKINIKNQFIIKIDSDQSSLHSQHHALARPLEGDSISQIPSAHQSNAKNWSHTIHATDVSEHHLQAVNTIEKQSLIHKRIVLHIDRYTRSINFLSQVAKRANPFLHPIINTLSKNNLPAELALLPIVESSYQPKAYSSKNAAGIWQFIPETGQEYDLAQNENYDERFDILASTQAAADYLTDLKRHYNGDWLLALAAYNCGASTVDNAITKNKAEGLETDYWSLALPEETQNYVPKFLALTQIFNKPHSYGLKLDVVRNEPSLIKITLDNPNDISYLANKSLTEIAQLADLDYAFFTDLNAAHFKERLAKTDSLSLVLPLPNANHLQQNLAKATHPTVTRQFYVMPPHPLLTDWFLSDNTALKSNLFLFLDVYSSFDNKRFAAKQTKHAHISSQSATVDSMPYYVDNNKSIATIAHQHGIKDETLFANNHIKPKQKLSWGQKLLVPKPTG